MKELLLAKKDDAKAIYELVQTTVKEIYPKYYLPEIIDMFCEYHNMNKILEDIEALRTYILVEDGKLIATGSIQDNHINRVYVLPGYQGAGNGSFIMEKLEKIISEKYETASIDASLPACRLYEKLGYKTAEHGIWECANGVIQVYEIMEKKLSNRQTSQKRVLCFGDSLTWGYDPESRTRFPEDVRWTGVLQNELGDGYKIIEEGQNGRTINTDDPGEGQKNGMKYLIPCLESQSPVDIMILMLGVNDTKRKFNYCGMDIAGEMQIMIEEILSYNQFRMGGRMKLLLVAPPSVGENIRDSWLGESFGYEEAIRVSKDLANWYKQLADMYKVEYLDASKLVEVSPSDSIHMDARNHEILGKELAKICKNL